MDLPNLDAKVCSRCLWSENSPDFKTPCEASSDGKHRLRSRKIWFGVLSDAFYDIHSPETAKRALGESGYTRHAYLLAQQFTDAEIQALREDRAVLVLSVVPVEDL
jgi:hypothetical protein